ncbi:hypothetical protein F7725_010173 [Dissostichus mawsoni]|uniref:Cadherin domain-containing protein n=1 Tax=Dissostichus mawsoni TaxID=36200 RepID=A0A7J5XMS4_DISMA|nr:hypothetical protein F7725_010173 [Dissostichus mawsoni]
MSKSNVISEDAELNTVVTMINIEDMDSGENGNVKCLVKENIPFTLKKSTNNFHNLVTDSDLDRETASEYNITVTCSDEGVPSLSSSVTLTLQISDVNDNAPVFDSSSYEAYIVENNTPGLSVFTVRARDADWNQNARVSYILQDSSVNGVPVSSYVSVSAESGVIHAVRSFDYEQIKEFHFRVRAQEGSPPVSSNVTVKILIQDQNDNPPQVLYPVQTGGSLMAEMVPRSADVGYLLTKVVAVDVDSGQNAWLSYKLQKATDRALFEVGLQNGEIRTIRQVTDKDAVKQRLSVIVEDNGHPSRSATDKEYNDNLTFYLVLALAVVSFLFITCLVVIISVKIYSRVHGQVSYSIPEEMTKGALIGNIAQDLGLTVERLKSGKARIYTGNTEEYIELKRERGVLLYKNRIDRESLCGPKMPCALHFQMIMENPMEYYTVTVEITDINDNPPTFERAEMKYEISESALTGARVVLEKAIDDDVGVNGLNSYALKPTDNFVLKTISRGDGTKHVEMVLQKPLDREKNEHISLILTALDGGEPQLSGTMQIIITVLDANDNPPVCSKPEYKASVTENAPVGTVITTVRATDIDKGNNGIVTYMISKSGAAGLFTIDANTGVLTLTGNVDYEKKRLYELDVQVSDQGGLSDACKVIMDVTDTNDNPRPLTSCRTQTQYLKT